jgi:hypothetical protein
LSDAPAGDKRRLNGGTEKTRSKMRMEERATTAATKRQYAQKPDNLSLLSTSLSFFFFSSFSSALGACGWRSY